VSIRILPDGTIETDTPDEALAVARGMAQAVADSMPAPGPSEEEPVADPEAVPDEPSEEVQRAVRAERYRAAEARLTKLMHDTLSAIQDYPDGVSLAGITRELSVRTGKKLEAHTVNNRMTRLVRDGLIRRPRSGTYVPVRPEDFTK